MAKRIKIIGNSLIVEDTISDIIEIEELSRNIHFDNNLLNNNIILLNQIDGSRNVETGLGNKIAIGNAVDENDVVFTVDTFRSFMRLIPKDVFLQDQHSPILIASMSLLEKETLLTTMVAIDDYDITVDDPTGFTVGKYVSIFNVDANRFYLGTILSTSGNPVTMDSPMDFAYTSGSFVTSGDKNMAKDGSSATIIFGLRNTETSISLSFDITQLIFTCLTSSPIDLSKFGDITNGLTKGIVLRKKDGEYINVFNIKTNQDLAGIAFEFEPLLASNPSHGQDGFIARLKFAGQNEIGVTLRLAPGEDIQILVQDALQTITSLEIVAEGHEVVD